MAKNIRT